jgi:hypothetical protein
VEVQLRDSGDVRAAARALGRAANGRELKRNLVREFRSLQAPLTARVKLAWRSAPAVRRAVRGRSLRGALARATRGQVRLSGREAGITIRTDGRRMPSKMKALPQYVEGTKRPWRHEVFGKDVYTIQQPFPRFYAAVRPDAGQARRKAERAVADVFAQIARGR